MTNRLSILQSAKKEHVRLHPFPHIVLPSCLPDSIYRELEESYPSDELICRLDSARRPKPGENKRVDISANSFLKNKKTLPSIWLDFVQYHTSRDFFLEVLDLFGEAIHASYPDLEDRIGRLAELQAGVRFCEKTDTHPLSLDCQVGINTPGSSTSTVIGPHTDSPDELYAGLLYFRREDDAAEGGHLDLYSWVDPHTKIFRDNHKVADYTMLKHEATILSSANTLVMFINTVDSVHGVSPRSPSTVSRRLVNVIGEVYNSVPGGLYKRPQIHGSEPEQPLGLRQRAKAKLKAFATGLIR